MNGVVPGEVGRYRIAIVEDNAMQRVLLKRILEEKYDVAVFPSGEAFLDERSAPDAILLDIEMPGISGYETCRRLHTADQDSDAPIIFVSAHNSAEARVEAYEAGGDHFVTKPVDAGELHIKIDSVIAHRNALRALKSQSARAQRVASSAMSGMGGLGIVIEFFRKTATVTDYQSLADLVVDTLDAWNLRGGVQIRGIAGEANHSTDAVISPLQSNVMATMRNMGRIFELKSRAVVNYEHASILVYNMPIDDPQMSVLMRDNLAWLGEGANACVVNLDATLAFRRQLASLDATHAQLTEQMHRVVVRDANNRADVQKRVIQVLEGLEVSVGSFGLTKIQNEYVTSMVREGIDELMTAFDDAASIHREFAEILSRLQQPVAPKTD